MFGLDDNDAKTSNPTDPAGDPSVNSGAVSGEEELSGAAVPVPPKPAEPQQFNSANNEDLLDIKQQALNKLQPLISHLDQSPEERFKTTMMLIQAADDPELVKEAFAAANQIKDEKTRAQALLDIVNEINYFTQHHDGGETKS